MRLFWLLVPVVMSAQSDRRILVVTASSRDYIFGAGATLARYVQEGWRVDVAQFGSDDKMSLGANPAQTRLANVQEGKAAAKLLGVTDVVLMDHESGELGYVSSTEMRQQLFALIRGMKPRVIFLPDPYVHYQEDRDQPIVGLMAEEAWGYSGGAMFGNELARMGFQPHGAPEVFFYSATRPYRAGEGGEAFKARFVARSIGDTLEQKITAAQLLQTRNRAWSALRPGLLEDHRVNEYIRAYLTEMAVTVGSKHGFQYGEEFNHVGASEPVPAHAVERARPRARQ
jgi:LmbE family N-acetylglucosaminyl deacetylase